MESCSSYFLPRLIGFSNASYLVSTGGVFPPTSKHFGDLFNEIMPDPSRVLPRALELATEIAENVSPASQYLNRALMWRNPGTPEEAHLLESNVICQAFASEYVIPVDEPDTGRDAHHATGTRPKALRHSLKSASPVSGPTSMTTRRPMYHGGLRLTRVATQRLRPCRSCKLSSQSEYPAMYN